MHCLAAVRLIDTPVSASLVTFFTGNISYYIHYPLAAARGA